MKIKIEIEVDHSYLGGAAKMIKNELGYQGGLEKTWKKKPSFSYDGDEYGMVVFTFDWDDFYETEDLEYTLVDIYGVKSAAAYY